MDSKNLIKAIIQDLKEQVRLGIISRDEWFVAMECLAKQDPSELEHMRISDASDLIVQLSKVKG